MNIEKYTQNAQNAVMECQNLGISSGNQTLEPEHLHMALLKQNDGLVPKLLANMGVDVDRMTEEVESLLKKLPKVSGNKIGRAHV